MDKSLQVIINNSSLLGALSRSSQGQLSSLFKPRAFNKNEVIFEQGEEGEGLYVIKSGKVKICTVAQDGIELIFTFLTVGDLLGEMSILDGRPRSATAIAAADTETLFVSRTDFMNYLKAYPQLYIEIIAVLCQRLRETDKHLEELSFLDVSGRLARKLIETAKDGLHNEKDMNSLPVCSISQEELATIVGASRVMVNKILNSFAELGLISIARKNIMIINSHELNRIARYEL